MFSTLSPFSVQYWYVLTPCSRLLEKLIVPQLLENNVIFIIFGVAEKKSLGTAASTSL
jgi:hypothetical protein